MLPIVVAAGCPIMTVFAEPITSIRAIDFKNSAYPWNEPGDGVPDAWRWLKASAKQKVRLVDGKRRFTDGDSLSLHSITYGDLDGDGQEDAAVDLLYRSGGTANWHYLFIYTSDRGRPRLLRALESGSRADGGLVRVEIANQLLILDFQDTERRTADCCSEGNIRVRYQWKQDRR